MLRWAIGRGADAADEFSYTGECSAGWAGRVRLGSGRGHLLQPSGAEVAGWRAAAPRGAAPQPFEAPQTRALPPPRRRRLPLACSHLRAPAPFPGSQPADDERESESEGEGEGEGEEGEEEGEGERPKFCKVRAWLI